MFLEAVMAKTWEGRFIPAEMWRSATFLVTMLNWQPLTPPTSFLWVRMIKC